VHIASVDGTPSEAFRRGAVGLVNKPLNQEDLEETFRRLERSSPGKRRRILVIDDDLVLRRETVRLLGDKDVKVDEGCLDEEGHIDIRKLDPIAFALGDATGEYFALGAPIGPAFSIGKIFVANAGS